MDPSTLDWGKCEPLLTLLHYGAVRMTDARRGHLMPLLAAGWRRFYGRSRRDLEIVPGHESDVRTRLSQWWPTWEADVAAAEAAGLDPRDKATYARMARRGFLQTTTFVTLPSIVNEKVAASLLEPHSKSGLSEAGRAVLGDRTLTTDHGVRVRTNVPTLIDTGAGRFDLAAMTAGFDEAWLPERLFLRGGLSIEGERPKAILTIENLGAFVETTVPDGILAVFCPGWNTHLSRTFLNLFPGIRNIHFGDYDANGLRIAEHLALNQSDREVLWFAPPFLDEYVDTHGLKADADHWPERASRLAPLSRLVSRSLWIEQESIVLDRRLVGCLHDPGSLIDLRSWC